jgi:hypothetical protein
MTNTPNTDDQAGAHITGIKRWIRLFILVKVGLLILVAVAVWRLLQ